MRQHKEIVGRRFSPPFLSCWRPKWPPYNPRNAASAPYSSFLYASSLARRRRPTKNIARSLYRLSNLWVTRFALVKRPCRSAYAAERKARFLACSELASCSIRRRSAAHLRSSSEIWRESSAAPISEIGIVRRNSASPASKATLLLGIVHSFVFTIWS